MTCPFSADGYGIPDPLRDPERNPDHSAEHLADIVMALDGPVEPMPAYPLPAGPLGLCPIESVRIEGRMLLAPQVSYSVSEETIHLYACCDRISETWVNVTITAEQLGEMLAAILKTRPNTEDVAYMYLLALCKRY